MSLIHRHHNELFERHMREFDRHIEEIHRDFERHFPKSWLNRDLWLRPRFDFDHHHFTDFDRVFEEHRREMRRHFDEIERHFSEIVRKHGFEIDHLGHREQILPRVVDGPNGKSMALDISLPKNVDPNKINVSIKDGDLVIQADDRVEKENEKSQMHYYRRSTLPTGVNVDQIKADLVNGNTLSISAPINPSLSGRETRIPINNV